MNCKTSHKIIIKYSEIKLGRPEYEDFHIHLKICKNCNRLFSEIELTCNIPNHIEPIQNNPFLYNKIIDKLKTKQEITTQNRMFYKIKPVLQPALFSLILVLSIFLGVKFGNTYTKPKNEIAEQQIIEYYFNDINQETIELLLLNE